MLMRSTALVAPVDEGEAVGERADRPERDVAVLVLVVDYLQQLARGRNDQRCLAQARITGAQQARNLGVERRVAVDDLLQFLGGARQAVDQQGGEAPAQDAVGGEQHPRLQAFEQRQGPGNRDRGSACRGPHASQKARQRRAARGNLRGLRSKRGMVHGLPPHVSDVGSDTGM